MEQIAMQAIVISSGVIESKISSGFG